MLDALVNVLLKLPMFFFITHHPQFCFSLVVDIIIIMMIIIANNLIPNNSIQNTSI